MQRNRRPVDPLKGTGRAAYRGAFGERWRVAGRVPLPEWADEHRIIAGKAASEPGKWRTDRAPYLREPLECLDPSHPCEDVILLFGTQLGKSETGNTWIAYIIDQDPGPAMLVQPTVDLAKRYSRLRLAPMIEAMPELRAKVPASRSRDGGNATLFKEFPGGVLAITGANSAAGLRSMPARYMFGDEIDTYPDDVDGEGDPIELAKKRSDTFYRRKRLLTSTPSGEESRICAAYADSDMRRFWVPCPHCHEYQILKWSGFTWETGEPSTVCYTCAECSEPIPESSKEFMLAAGEWRAERPGYNGGRVVGFHLPAWYAPFGWRSWRSIVEEFLAAKAEATRGKLEKLKTWTNTAPAEQFTEDAQTIDAAALAARAEPYRQRTADRRVALVVMSVDVQGNRLEYQITGVGAFEESWVIEWSALYGDPSLAEVWGRLLEVMKAPIRRGDGQWLPIRATAIDSGGHHTHAVYSFCRTNRRHHAIAIKGKGGPLPVLGRPSLVDIDWRGERIKDGVQLWTIGVDTAKTEIANRLRLVGDGQGRMHFSDQLTHDYYDQLLAETPRTKRVRGQKITSWELKPGARNEALDLTVYGMAAVHYCGANKWDEKQWAAAHRLTVDPQTTISNAPAATRGRRIRGR